VSLRLSDSAAERDRFVLEHRGARAHLDPWHHQGVVIEDERTAEGHVARVATVFLTGRECPWRCTMCDLWKHTTEADTPRGAIPAQIGAARDELRDCVPAITTMKLYNAGSFFDPRAVPVSDYGEIATRLIGLDHVIVESHPALIGQRVDLLLDALNQQHLWRRPSTSSGRPEFAEGRGFSPARSADTERPALEVAMGLETANPTALDLLNKRFTIDQFRSAAAALRARSIAVRVFLLISPPFVADEDQDAWLIQSIDVAFASGASVVSLVPTRSGNGAMERLAAADFFREPSLGDVERSLAIGLAAAGGRGRVFVDLWGLQRFAFCPACFERRKTRLHTMNLAQTVSAPAAACARCGVFDS
jgi:archaeosine synthase beta-subunit